MREKRDFIVIMWGAIILLFLLIYIFQIIDNQKDRDFEYNIAKQGGIDRYLESKGYGLKNYEKFEPNDEELRRIPYEDIANFYAKKGYDVRYVRTGQYNGYHEAIKLKTN